MTTATRANSREPTSRPSESCWSSLRERELSSTKRMLDRAESCSDENRAQVEKGCEPFRRCSPYRVPARPPSSGRGPAKTTPCCTEVPRYRAAGRMAKPTRPAIARRTRAEGPEGGTVALAGAVLVTAGFVAGAAFAGGDLPWGALRGRRLARRWSSTCDPISRAGVGCSSFAPPEPPQPSTVDQNKIARKMRTGPLTCAFAESRPCHSGWS